MLTRSTHPWTTLRRAGLALLLVSLLVGGLGNEALSLLLPQATQATSSLPSTEEEEQSEKKAERESSDDEAWNHSRGAVRHNRQRTAGWIPQLAFPLRRWSHPDQLPFSEGRLPRGSGVFLRC